MSTEPLSPSHMDLLLTAQMAVAWAGEQGDEDDARLGWWKTDLVSEFGGEDLFRRLLPHTWRWAVYEAVREAARRKDAELRKKAHDPDTIVSLFNLGFELDERVEERLQDLKRSGVQPIDALPGLRDVIAEVWDAERFASWVQGHGEADFKTVPVGRELKGTQPALDVALKQLVAALTPVAEAYPLPHYRRAE